MREKCAEAAINPRTLWPHVPRVSGVVDAGQEQDRSACCGYQRAAVSQNMKRFALSSVKG